MCGSICTGIGDHRPEITVVGRQRLLQDSKTAANGGLSVTEWIICETDSRRGLDSMLLAESARIALVAAEHHSRKIELSRECPNVNRRSICARHRILSDLSSGRPVGILHGPVQRRHLGWI